jgi:hypothetical protein
MVYDDLNRFLDVQTIADVKVRDGSAVERSGVVIREGLRQYRRRKSAHVPHEEVGGSCRNRPRLSSSQSI